MPFRLGLVTLVLLALAPFAAAQKEFGFDNRKDSGQPYLTPQETVAKMTVPPEFEVKLFAGEPQVVNPVAFTIDERGRAWVLECFEYPSKTPKGKKPRDRIVILEDTDGDGAADKRTLFAEGKDFPVPPERAKDGLPAFDLATGLEVGHGKVFVGAPPYLWTIEITGGNNDKPGKFETVLSGFGSQDTHETLNTFTWGPDGNLYGMQGVFTQSKVQPLDGPDTRMNAAVWRYHPVTKKFEITAEGTSNPWGIDWRNTDGEFILACCVIPHLYHIVPGGIYKRQAGQSYNTHAYGYIQEISDHTFYKESGWAHAGLLSLDVPIMPKRFRNSVIFGSIHGCSLKQNILKPNGSSYTASRGDDFLQSGDKNFRPINLKWGPHGDIYLIDWHDKNPCHQAAAGSWDYSRGRVYRIQLKGRKGGKADDLGKRSIAELTKLALDETDPWARRAALRLINAATWQGRKPDGTVAVSPEVEVAREKVAEPRVEQSWAENPFPLALLSTALRATYFPSREQPAKLEAWWVRQIVPPPVTANGVEKVIAPLAATPSPVVRRELAILAGRMEPPESTVPLLHALMAHKEDANDPLIPHLTWYAYEKVLASQSKAGTPVKGELAWLTTAAPGNAFVRDQIVPRVMRRVVALDRPDDLALCLDFARDTLSGDPATARAALEGLATALDKRTVTPPAGWDALQPVLMASGDGKLRELAGKLAVSFRDPKVAAASMVTAKNPKESAENRSEAIRRLATLQPAGAGDLLTAIATGDGPTPVRVEAARALGAFDAPGSAAKLLAGWKTLPPEVRAEAVTVLASRRPSAKALLTAMKAGTVARNELTDNTVIKMQALKDKAIDALIETAWGRTRTTPTELLATIDKMRAELNAGPGDFARGRAVFEANCAKCHAFEGRGQAVGPPLDGAGRDIEYILANVIDPNRVVGAPYFLRTLTTIDGCVEQGLLQEEDDKSITLKVENGVLKRIPKADIDGAVKVVEKSMMPEGLTYGMKPGDFRDLVRYLMANPYLTAGTLGGKPLAAPVSGRVALPKGEARIEFPVVVAARVKTQLQLDTTASYKVLLDGKPVAAGAGSNSYPVTIPAGSHMLSLTAVSGGGMLTARLLDPDRKLTNTAK